MKVIDLFAGVGGWSTGARQAGHEVIAAIEYDQTAAEYYARNHGPHVICADILSVNPHDMPACDILLAGPPAGLGLKIGDCVTGENACRCTWMTCWNAQKKRKNDRPRPDLADG